MGLRNAPWVGTLAFVASVARVAAAQEPAPPPPPPVPPPAVRAPEPPAPRATEPQVQASPPPPAESIADHDRFIGHVGVTYFDITNLPMAAQGTGAGPIAPGQPVPAPVVGVRYWLQRGFGLDLGLGIGWSAGSTSQTVQGMNMSVPNPVSPFGFALHAGVPIVLADGQHYSFLVIPETTFGYATETIKQMGLPDTTQSGLLFNLGARAGAEIHFGFIGIPQLALQGSIGLFFTYDQYKISQGSGATENSASLSVPSLSTTVGSNPWAIFTNNVSATYYL
jgi:hypothetical protein